MKLEVLFLQCISKHYTHTKRDVSYATEQVGGELFLFFECSNGSMDWARNFNFPARPYGDCKNLWFCHRGFLGAWKEVLPLLSPIILDKSVQNATVVGYSHGAAIALLCHEYIWFHRPDLRGNLQGVGFGCPRVIWGPTPQAVLARWENFLVVRNLDDIVTHLPPALFGFHHVSPVLEIGKKGRYTRVDAHRPENYLRELHGL